MFPEEKSWSGVERRNRLRASEAKPVRLVGRSVVVESREEMHSGLVVGKLGDVIWETVLVGVVVTDVGSPLLPIQRLALEARRAWSVGGLTVGVNARPGMPQRVGLRHALERGREIGDLVF